MNSVKSHDQVSRPNFPAIESKSSAVASRQALRKKTAYPFSTARLFVEFCNKSLASCIPGRDYMISCTAWVILAFVPVPNMSKPTGKPKRLSKKVPRDA
jgi:hypothetical protein